jgi:hypothetical protein
MLSQGNECQASNLFILSIDYILPCPYTLSPDLSCPRISLLFFANWMTAVTDFDDLTMSGYVFMYIGWIIYPVPVSKRLSKRGIQNVLEQGDEDDAWIHWSADSAGAFNCLRPEQGGGHSVVW